MLESKSLSAPLGGLRFIEVDQNCLESPKPTQLREGEYPSRRSSTFQLTHFVKYFTVLFFKHIVTRPLNKIIYLKTFEKFQ